MNRLKSAHYVLLTSVVLAASCARGQGDSVMPEDMLARVGSEVLTLGEVSSIMPFGLSEEDSAKFVRGYVRTWVDHQLVGAVAMKNIPDSKGIEKMVENYRTELIMWEYRKMMFAQNAPSFFNEDSLRAYYDNHSGSWKSDTPLFKGIFVRVPATNPNIEHIRRWSRSSRTSDIENLEKITLSDTIVYDYFREQWISWSELRKLVPFDRNFSPDVYWQAHKTFEVNQDGQVYMLSISDYMPAGSDLPFELAVDDIKEQLTNERRNDYDRELKDGLFYEGLKSGELELRIKLD